MHDTGRKDDMKKETGDQTVNTLSQQDLTTSASRQPDRDGKEEDNKTVTLHHNITRGMPPPREEAKRIQEEYKAIDIRRARMRYA